MYCDVGGGLQQAAAACDPLSRLVAVARLAIALACDICRPASVASSALQPRGDPQCSPVALLGQHYLSHRDLGRHSDGTHDRAYVQEICTFDPEERPKQLRKIGTEVVMPSIPPSSSVTSILPFVRGLNLLPRCT